MSNPYGNSDDIAKLILRITLGGLLLVHGITKILHGIGRITQAVTATHLPAFFSYGVYAGEVLAPLLVILGLWTRPAALVVAVDLIFAVALVAWPRGAVLGPGGGWGLELEAFYFLVAIVLLIAGGGKYSLTRKKIPWE